MSEARPRWFTDHGDDHASWYIERFRTMARDGADLAGEARFVDALLGRGARVLDAGSGTGRVSAALAERGHTVVGVDVDSKLVEAARADHPGPRFLIADLSTLSLADEQPFDAAVLAGNVLVFVTPGSERQVLTRVAAHVHPDGFLVTGFATDRTYRLAAFDADCAAAGLVLEHRFATWDLRPWRDDAPWAVSVLRVPGRG
jgi:2-polyprenyl-3-methyl-5-hydroxy-6-metoxy-1,4-benzoquinol methylase